ncbi:MAG: ABC transporter permease [Gemmatimonadota bacterium]
MRRVFRLRLGRATLAREVDDELAFHLQMRAEKLVTGGMISEEARREALRQFGDIESVRRSCLTIDQQRERAMSVSDILSELRQDAVYAVRMLHRNLGFTAVIVGTLALGIGANTAIFTLIDAVLLRKLPVEAPDRLVAVGDPGRPGGVSMNPGPQGDLLSYNAYQRLRERAGLLTGLLASGRAEPSVLIEKTAGAEAEHPSGRFVSGNYFKVLGVPAARGRTFDDAEDRVIGAAPVVMISDGYWTSRFARDPAVIGRSIVVDGTPMSIIGVTPPTFTGDVVGRPTDIWLPLTMQSTLMPNRPWLSDPSVHWLLLLGRMAPGVSLDQARATLESQVRQANADNGSQGASEKDLREMKIYVSSGAKGFSRMRGAYELPLLTLMVGVALLMLIICANVANLLLARAIARGREMGVRLAIGAGRFRLVRQLLTESVLLALLGATAGLGLAWWGSHVLLALAADGAPAIALDVRLDAPVLAFTVALSALAVGAFGLMPALRSSRVDLAQALRAGARSVNSNALGARGQRMPMGRLLIAGQVALSLVLLVGAALLVRSLSSVEQADTGLDRDHLLIVELDALAAGYRGDRLASLTQELSERFSRLPGVAAVAFSENGIFSGTESMNSFSVPGFVARTREDSVAATDRISPGYVTAIGGHLLRGREFTAQDAGHAPRVVILNETMAQHYFPGTNPIGATMRFDDTTAAEIVGVVASIKDHDLEGAPIRRFYSPYLQFGAGEPGSLRFEIRASGNPADLVMPVRQQIKALDPSLLIGGIDPLSLLMRQSVREDRLLARLASGFGVLALLLAAVGLYGVMTYAITRRTGEIGLRVALGAQRGDVIAMVVRDALGLVLLGLVIGLPLALASARLLRSQLHGIEPSDPVSIAIALVVLLASAIVAAFLPALRAARVEPLVALRQE